MVDTQASAEDRFEAAGPPHPAHHACSFLSREAVTLPFGWVRLWEGRSPSTEGASSAYVPSHPGEKRPWPGASSAPAPVAKGWAWPGCSCEGPGRRESKAAVWAPLSSPGFKEVQTNSVPVPGGSSSSLLEAPDCSPPPPPASSWKASSASVPGASQRGLDSWLCRRKGEALPG